MFPGFHRHGSECRLGQLMHMSRKFRDGASGRLRACPVGSRIETGLGKGVIGQEDKGLTVKLAGSRVLWTWISLTS